MAHHLLFAVHLYADGMGTARYHGMHQGVPEWPPAPARVYQALVAGAARGQVLPDNAASALQWLEQLPPPVIAAPVRKLGQAVSLYVPNNDADALADPSDVSGIRTAKQVQPSLFDGTQPILYAWPLSEGDAPVAALMAVAHALYQLGRGVDMAWANADVLDDDALHRRLSAYRGTVQSPSPVADGASGRLPCPVAGSLVSLLQRHRATRLHMEGVGRKARTLFTNPPKPRFVSTGYAPRRRLHLYELRGRDGSKPWPWSLHRAVALVEQLRDAAAARLRLALGEDAASAIERCLVGRDAQGQGIVPLEQRVRILPLPSIGATHADHAIRRIAVEVPGACPLAEPDIEWAFSGLEQVDADTGELSPWVLTRADDLDMLARYSAPSRHWQTVTAAALPQSASRRRIDPGRLSEEAKSSAERQHEEARAVSAVHDALRHAGLRTRAVQVSVRREPFNDLGQRAETWGQGTRFTKERLWHVALVFEHPVDGPLAIGDGRFVGLGVLAPSHAAQGHSVEVGGPLGLQTDGVLSLQWIGGDDPATTEPLVMARALRRAVMARVRRVAGGTLAGGLARFVGGHAEAPGAPDDQPSHHLAFHWDAARTRWLVLAPHRLQKRSATWSERQHMAAVDEALDGLTELRAGGASLYAVQRQAGLSDQDPMLASASDWETATPYTVTRHRRLNSADEALVADVLAECRRCSLPPPEVTVLRRRSVPGHGLQAHLRLRFAVAVAGPVALGRSGLLGGGLFAAVDDPSGPRG